MNHLKSNYESLSRREKFNWRYYYKLEMDLLAMVSPKDICFCKMGRSSKKEAREP